MQRLAALVAQTCPTYFSVWCLATLSAVSFLLSSTAVALPPPIPSVGYPSTPCCPPSPPSLGRHPRRMRGAAYSAMPHPRAISPRTIRPLEGPPGTTSRPLLLQWTTERSHFQTPRGGCSVDPSVAWNTLRPSTLHLCRVLNCPPGLGFSPPAIVPNIGLPPSH